MRWARTLKNRFVVEVPYVPGNAPVQVIKSVLDSRIMFTGPPESAGMTTALLGIICSVGPFISTLQKTGKLLLQASVIVAGPAIFGKPGV